MSPRSLLASLLLPFLLLLAPACGLIPSATGGAPPPPSGSLSVSSIDVGQGDGVLVQAGLERYLIATFGPSSALPEYFQRSRGVEKLDGIVLSNPDADHIGSFLFDPKDVPHAFSVDSGPARLLFLLSPAGMEGLIREMGEPARSLSIPPPPEEPPDDVEMGRLMAIAGRYGGEMLGPPPSR